MRKLLVILLALLSFTTLLTSCHGDRELSQEEEKTLAVRKLYYHKMIGEWYYEERTDRDIDYISYNCKEKGKLETYKKRLTREAITKNGKVEYGDWEVVEDETTTGEWRLGWSEAENANYFSTSIHYGNNATNVEIHYFEYVNDAELVIGYFGIGGKMFHFKRGNPGIAI